MGAVTRICLGVLICAMPAALAQSGLGERLAEASTYGAVATLAPLCHLRDDAWAADLRRAALRSAGGTEATDDAGLTAAPEHGKAAAALGYADMEALEDFAADGEAATCAGLKANPALPQADAAVRAFRQARDGTPVG